MRDRPVLMALCPDKHFVSVADASEFALGACLEQNVVSSGIRRPIAFPSHALTDAEDKYPGT
jgi:hypothetical protein